MGEDHDALKHHPSVYDCTLTLYVTSVTHVHVSSTTRFRYVRVIGYVFMPCLPDV